MTLDYAVEALVTQATQRLFKAYPWLAVIFNEQIKHSTPLPIGEDLTASLAARFNHFVSQDEHFESGFLYLWDPNLIGEAGPEALTVEAQANVLAARVEHGIFLKFPGADVGPPSTGSYLDSDKPLADTLKSSLVGILYSELLQQQFIKQWHYTSSDSACPAALLADFREEVCARYRPPQSIVAGVSARQWFVQHYVLPLLPALQSLVAEKSTALPSLPAVSAPISAEQWLIYQHQKIATETQQAMRYGGYILQSYHYLLPDFIATSASSTDKWAAFSDTFKNITNGLFYDLQLPGFDEPIDPEDNMPLISVADYLETLFLAPSLINQALRLCSSLASLQSAFMQPFNKLMGEPFSPRFSSVLQLELYTYLWNAPPAEAKKSLSERLAVLIYQQCVCLAPSIKERFNELAEVRPELKEVITLMMDQPPQAEWVKSRPVTAGFSALLATPEVTTERLSAAMVSKEGVGDNGLAAARLPAATFPTMESLLAPNKPV